MHAGGRACAYHACCRASHPYLHTCAGQDFIFFSDCIKNFFTGYVDETETVILQQSLIVQRYLLAPPPLVLIPYYDDYISVVRYLKTWFLIDFVSSIPFDFIVKSSIDENSDTKVTGSETKLLKVVCLLRLD